MTCVPLSMSVQVFSPPHSHSEAKTCASVEVQTTMPSSDRSECRVTTVNQVWHIMMKIRPCYRLFFNTLCPVQATPIDSKEGKYASQSTQTDRDLNGGDSPGLKLKSQVRVHDI